VFLKIFYSQNSNFFKNKNWFHNIKKITKVENHAEHPFILQAIVAIFSYSFNTKNLIFGGFIFWKKKKKKTVC